MHDMDVEAASPLSRLWSGPPGPVFHALAAIPALVLLWAFSVPGFNLFEFGLATLFLLFAAAVWIVRGISYLVAVAHDRAHGNPAWFVLAPCAAMVVGLLVLLHVPTRVRWAASRHEFNVVAAHARPAGSTERWVSVEVPAHVGAYDIQRGYRAGHALILYEAHGDLFDDAGFAYLPDGPDPALANGSFEAPQYTRLGGDWYSWTASW